MKKLLLIFILLCPRIHSQDKVRIAVLPFTGVSSKEGGLFASLFSQELAKNNLLEPLVRNEHDIARIMNEFKFQAKGLTESQKKARIGAALNTKYLVSGEVQALGGSWVLSLSVFDMETLSTKAGNSRVLKKIEEVPAVFPDFASEIAPIMAATGEDGSVRIILAKRSGQKGISEIQTLLLRGINAGNSQNKTALMTAAEQGYGDAVSALLREGADIHLVDNRGKTALMYAVAYIGIVESFLDKGADINAQTTGGSTALMFASQDGHYLTVRLLLERGAEADARTMEGVSALQLARSNDHKQVIKLLKKAVR